MKILIVHERFPPDYGGGGEYVMLKTAQALQSRGVEVRVLTAGDPSVREFEGIPTMRLGMSRYRLNLAGGIAAEQAKGMDAILTATYHGCLPAIAAGKACNIPVICLVMGLFGNIWRSMRPPIIANLFVQLERFLVTRPFDRWIFLTDFSRQLGTEMGVPVDRSIVACPGIDLPGYAPAPIKDDVVFITGKLDPRKGIFEVLAAAARLPDVRFHIMGWGSLEQKLKAQATPNIEFFPYERGEPLRAAFGKARVFLFPTRGETLGIAQIEAMASGCAIISSVPLPFEGVRVEAGDVDGIVRAIRELWDDPVRCRIMGERNRQLAQAYTWDNYTDRLLECFTDCLASPPLNAHA